MKEHLRIIDPTFDTTLDLDFDLPKSVEVVSKPIRVPTIRKAVSTEESPSNGESRPATSLPKTALTRRVIPVLFSNSTTLNSSKKNSISKRPTGVNSKINSNFPSGPTSLSEKVLAKLNIPPYSPPPLIDVSFFRHACGTLDFVRDGILNRATGNIKDSRFSSSFPLSKLHPKKPTIPICRTNTNMLTYIHKLYIYEQFMKANFEYKPIPRSQRVRSLRLSYV